MPVHVPIPEIEAGEDASIARSARAIYRFYLSYRHGFRRITLRARRRFADRDWAGMQRDVGERFDVYQERLSEALSRVKDLLGDAFEQEGAWTRIRAAYLREIGGCEDRDLAETFFNSVARRVFSTVGVNPDIEIVRPQGAGGGECSWTPMVRRHPVGENLEASFARILDTVDLGIPFDDRDGDARRIARRIEAFTGPRRWRPEAVEMARTAFYRGKGVYFIGRLLAKEAATPFALAMVNRNGRAVCDGLILDTSGMRLLFSYTHSYFHVDTDSAVALVRYLNGMLPDKRPAELFISLGYNRHGKTELYRDLVRHRNFCDTPFEISPGKPGMVMTVFNMPGEDIVFKVIKDRFAHPKRTTPAEVKSKYDYVARHDRAGRLPDTQSFEYLEFDRCCFSDGLLETLAAECGRSVAIGDDSVVLNFVYVERRVVPLDLFISQAAPAAARAAVIDFGNAIKDLAKSNIFPGDMLLKNFGVTGLGRVIFYDYDEICPLTECRFRTKPKPRHEEDELSGEPWYHVEENDVFPEEFAHFLGLTGRLRDLFLEHHEDLLAPAFWKDAQDAVRSGRLYNVYPYERFPEMAAAA